MKSKAKKAGVMSGLSESSKFQAGPENVSVPTGKGQFPVKKVVKVGKSKIG